MGQIYVCRFKLFLSLEFLFCFRLFIYRLHSAICSKTIYAVLKNKFGESAVSPSITVLNLVIKFSFSHYKSRVKELMIETSDIYCIFIDISASVSVDWS